MQHLACESRSYVIGCNQFFRYQDYPEKWRAEAAPEAHCAGGSVIVSPLGEVLAGPLWEQEGVLYASISQAELVKARMDFDPFGHYHRALPHDR